MMPKVHLRPSEFVAGGIAVWAAGAIASLQIPQLNALKNQDLMSAETVQRIVRTEELNVSLMQQSPVFGFGNLMASWAFLNFLQYFGEEPVRVEVGYALSPEYFEVIVEHDPHFEQSYLFLSTSTSLYSGQPERSVQLMEKGLASMTPTTPERSFFIWRHKGIDELLFLGDHDAAKQSFLTAAEWAEESPDPGSDYVADLSRRTAEFLEGNPDSRSAQVTAWSMVLSSALDDRSRNTAIRAIEALGGKALFDEEGNYTGVELPTEGF